MASFSGAGLELALSVAGPAAPPTLSPIHTLSISAADVSACAINGSGEWIAFGAAALGQLLVWEWQSETYVLKQQVSTLNGTTAGPGAALL